MPIIPFGDVSHAIPGDSKRAGTEARYAAFSPFAPLILAFLIRPVGTTQIKGSFISPTSKAQEKEKTVLVFEGLISTLLLVVRLAFTYGALRLSSSNKCAKSGRWYRIINRSTPAFSSQFSSCFAPYVFSSLDERGLRAETCTPSMSATSKGARPAILLYDKNCSPPLRNERKQQDVQ